MFTFLSIVPQIAARIINEVESSNGQQHYNLTCAVSGAKNLNAVLTYEWNKNIGGNQTKVGGNSNFLTFSPVRLSDAGQYTCHVMVQSPYLHNELFANVSESVTLESE